MKKLKLIEIKKLIKENIEQKDIAKMYGVDKSIISKISTGKIWTHLSSKNQL